MRLELMSYGVGIVIKTGFRFVTGVSEKYRRFSPKTARCNRRQLKKSATSGAIRLMNRRQDFCAL